jgi:hypothetical protein
MKINGFWLTGIMILFFTSCGKKNWNLEKKPTTLVKTFDCSSLDGLNAQYTYVYNGANTNTSWVLMPYGYKGDCLAADDPNINNVSAFQGFIEFQYNFSTEGFLTFWKRDPEIPNFYIDDVLQSPLVFSSGSQSYDEWMQLKSKSILPGVHTIRIEFTPNSFGADRKPKIDEIEIWELK